MPLAVVPVNCSPGCGDECECKSYPRHRVFLPVLCCTATRLLLLQNMSDPWHSVQLLVLCVYLLEWFGSKGFAAGGWIYHQTVSMVQSAVPLLTNCTLLGGNANLYSEYSFLCIRLNSSQIHSSNINIAACAAPFIPLHTLQLLVQCAYQHPQPHIQHSLSFEYFTCCILSACSFCNARTFWIEDPTQRSYGSSWPSFDTLVYCFL